MPTTLVLPPQAGGAPPVEVRVEFHVFVLGPELPAPFEVRAMEDPSERQAITCRVVSRGGVVPYEALIVKYCSLLCCQPHHAKGGRVVPCGSEGSLPVTGAGWIGGRLREVPKLGSGSKAAMWHFSVSSQEKGFCIVRNGVIITPKGITAEATKALWRKAFPSRCWLVRRQANSREVLQLCCRQKILHVTLQCHR